MSRFFSEKLAALAPYTPGEQPLQVRRYVKLNTNESPFPPSRSALEYAANNTRRLNLYPDPECRELAQKIADTYGVQADMVLPGNGSDEILNFAFLAFCDQNCPAAFADITYGFYPVFAAVNCVPYIQIPLGKGFRLQAEEYCGINATSFIANPNSPTGRGVPVRDIERILKSNPDNLTVVDEAYVDFGGESAVKLLKDYDNLLVVQTFSKSRSLAGARLGYGIGSPDIIRDLNTIKYSTNPYNINSYTMAMGIGVLEDDEYTAQNCRTIIENRRYAADSLEKLGFEVVDSEANFLFVRSDRIEGGALYRALKDRGVLIRHFDRMDISDYNRITIGTREQMDILLKEIREILEEK